MKVQRKAVDIKISFLHKERKWFKTSKLKILPNSQGSNKKYHKGTFINN